MFFYWLESGRTDCSLHQVAIFVSPGTVIAHDYDPSDRAHGNVW